jgi:hypothetical protein
MFEGDDGMPVSPQTPRSKYALIALFAQLLLTGCSGSQSSSQALDASLKNAGLTQEAVYPLGGKLQVDGAPPQLEKGEKIIVVLCNPERTSEPPSSLAKRLYIGPDGKFAFGTYRGDDGVKPGTYVLIFAKLKVKKNKGLVGPDEFLNLYNDPARNLSEHPEFKIDHKAPGKSDYIFNLTVAGHDAVEPGPGALTHVDIRGQR